MDFVIQEHHVYYVDGRWAVKPAQGDVVATFDSFEAAIENGYRLAEAAGDILVIFDKHGTEVERLDPEDELELAPHVVETLRKFEAGELEFFEYTPSTDTTDHVETTIHDSDTSNGG